jgi:hypothetical protein
LPVVLLKPNESEPVVVEVVPVPLITLEVIEVE